MRIRLNLATSLKMFLVSFGIGAGLVAFAQPVNSVSSVTLTGTGAVSIGISAGDSANATVTGGGTSPTVTAAATDAADGFNDSYQLGTLSAGNGTNVVARFPLRVRGSSAMHVSWCVSSYTASNIGFAGTALTGSPTSAAQLTFIKLGTQPMTAGSRGNLTGATYQASFLNGLTINNGNTGVIAATPVSSNEKFVSFVNPPSMNGNLTHPQNWVETYATFSVPTGFQWSALGVSPNWNVVVSFVAGAGA